MKRKWRAPLGLSRGHDEFHQEFGQRQFGFTAGARGFAAGARGFTAGAGRLTAGAGLFATGAGLFTTGAGCFTAGAGSIFCCFGGGGAVASAGSPPSTLVPLIAAWGFLFFGGGGAAASAGWPPSTPVPLIAVEAMRAAARLAASRTGRSGHCHNPIRDVLGQLRANFVHYCTRTRCVDVVGSIDLVRVARIRMIFE